MRRPEEVFVFVRRGGEYLVLHRAPAGGSYWHGVAGALEPGEDYPEAARRELEEEPGWSRIPFRSASDMPTRSTRNRGT